MKKGRKLVTKDEIVISFHQNKGNTEVFDVKKVKARFFGLPKVMTNKLDVSLNDHQKLSHNRRAKKTEDQIHLIDSKT